MDSFVIYGLSGDPLSNATLSVLADYRVDITDDDGSLEDPDQNGTVQFDTTGLPGTINSANLQVFEEYTGVVNGNPVEFNLIRFSGQDLIVVTSGTMATGDTITGITLVTFNGSAVDYNDLPTFICFTPGALIATPEGDRPVQKLEVGDLVTTKDNGAQPIRYIARRMFKGRELLAYPHLKPVVIRAGALGDDIPRRDLKVSPQHRMVISGWRAEMLFGEDEVMAPAIALVNDKMVRIAHGARHVEYIHLLFDSHQVIFAEGAATESLHPGETALDSMGAASRDELLEIYPEFAHMGVETFGAAARPSLRAYEAVAIADQAVASRPKKPGKAAVREVTSDTGPQVIAARSHSFRSLA